ncbi:MAG: tetratricopeptide repeat protein [Vicinamibacteria bacterium]
MKAAVLATAALACGPLAHAATTPATVAQSEKAARAAQAQCAAGDRGAEARAREALLLTADFDPTAFVRAGRQGEVVEDAYVAAREEYRRHRAVLYAAVGECLAAAGQATPAGRYLGRAALLDPAPERKVALAKVRLAEQRAQAALDLLLPQAGGAADAVLLSAAADAVGLPSAQVEVDRVRVRAVAGAVPIDGPLKVAPSARLSTGGPLRLAGGPIVVYVAASACQTCSADLQALKRAAGSARVVVLPEDPDRDQALRQVMGLYKYDWPVLVGAGAGPVPGTPPASLVVIARDGWLAVRLPASRVAALPDLLAILGREDVTESRPRAAWNGRPVGRETAPTGAPAFLPEGLAPGEDLPAPAPFTEAVAAFGAGRFADAMRLLEAATADGWLLPPEARFDRAVCLARMGRKEEARRLLLRIGDSRFHDDIDRVMEGLNVRRP